MSKAGGYYNGTWSNDKKSGQGEQLYPNGDKYFGEWIDDEPNGRGNFFKAGEYSQKWFILKFY